MVGGGSQTQPRIPSNVPPTIGYGDENEDFTSPYACSKLKEAFDKCFFAWYSDKFLKGIETKDECRHLWTPYQTCVRKKLRAMDIEKDVFPETNPTSNTSSTSSSK